MSIMQVILVDEQDNPVGTAEKMQAHYNGGSLHRAFSVFIFNRQGEMLLQQRAMEKYHSGGLWTNACCSHPQPGEETRDAALRRLSEELGFTTPVTKIFDFLYKAEFDNGLTEHEFDHVFVGQYEEAFQYNPEEVMDTRYMKLEELRESLRLQPEIYTAWFHLAFPRIEEWWQQEYANNKLTNS
jgi:isopentenyl-diphosphate Delta-isomerase